MTAVLANPTKATISGTIVIAHGNKFAFLSIAFSLKLFRFFRSNAGKHKTAPLL
jgi:hypothetical protein